MFTNIAEVIGEGSVTKKHTVVGELVGGVDEPTQPDACSSIERPQGRSHFGQRNTIRSQSWTTVEKGRVSQT